LLEYVLDTYKQESGIDLRSDNMALQRLREAAEKAKIELSSTVETDINLPYITADATGPKHLQMKITRAKYEDLIRALVKRTLDPCAKCLKDAGVSKDDITEVILVGGMTRTPLVVEEVKKFFGKDPFKGVNPDEAVAMGAAIQAGVLQGSFSDLVLLDVTPLSLGIETLGGVFTRLIDRNSTIPCKQTKTFSTAADGQTEVEIKVLQGEREFAKDNSLLGSFQLMGIPPAPKGVPQIDVTFDIDANGILNVSARDQATGKEKEIRIQSSGGLSKEQIERMVREGEEHAAEDQKRKEYIETTNHADSVIYDVNKNLSEHKDKLSQDKVDMLKEEIKKVEEAKKSNDSEVLKAATNELQQKQIKAFEDVYKQSSAGSSESASQDSSTEANYEDVSKDKKE